MVFSDNLLTDLGGQLEFRSGEDLDAAAKSQGLERDAKNNLVPLGDGLTKEFGVISELSEMSLETLRRKRDQATDMIRLAMADNDNTDARRHAWEARQYSSEIMRRK